MQQWKKVIAVVLSFVIVLTGISVDTKILKAAGGSRFYAKNVVAKPGDVIEIPIEIIENTGLMGLGLDFKFDKSVLTPMDETSHTSLLTGYFNDSIEKTLKNQSDTFSVLWQGTDNMTGDGELFTLKFKVSEQASGSTDIIMSLRQDDTFDENYGDVVVKCQPVTVTVEGKTPTTNTPQFYAEDVITKQGDVIEITVGILGNTGLMGIGLDFKFDKSVLTPMDETSHTSLLTGYFNDSIEKTLKDQSDTFSVLWQGTDNMTGDGELFTLKFKVSEQASGFTDIIMSLRQDDTFDENYGDVVVKCQPVTVSVKKGIPTPIATQNPIPTPVTTQNPIPTPIMTQNPIPTPIVTQKPNKTNAPVATGKPVYSSGSNTSWQNSFSETSVKKPKKVTLKKVKALGKKKVKITWKWLDVYGFQLQYAQNRGFSKKKKTKKFSRYEDIAIIKNLKKGKVYYFRVRAYEKSGGQTKYGSWSKVKKCKVK